MSSEPNNYLNAIQNMDEKFQMYLIISFVVIILIFFIGYMIYLSNLDKRNCDFMNSTYSSVNGYIKSINETDPDLSGNLFDYYIKTAYNACSGGNYKNDFVNICNLKAVIKQGVRCLDFEIYSVDDKAVVSTSTTDSYYVKETFNSVKFSSVMDTIRNYAFSGSTCPNPTDPIIIHLRCKSNNHKMYENLANIFEENTDIMLGIDYSFESEGTNLGNVPLLDLRNKVVLIIDRSNTAFLDNKTLLEYVNMTSNSIFMRLYDFNDVKNSPDIEELIEFNRRGVTMITPNNGSNPENPAGIVCRASGCQMVAMRYQYIDEYLLENTLFFDRAGYAFALKPYLLRYRPVTIPEPTPQNPDYSYATRKVETDFYSFNF